MVITASPMTTPAFPPGDAASRQNPANPNYISEQSLVQPGLLTENKNSLIVVIDDDPLNVRVARKYLNSWGYERVRSTTESVDAVNFIRDQPPDLILLDVMMPDVNGLEILEVLRSNPVTSFIPVIILTAHTEDSVKLKALELGANDFLPKPIDPNEMLPRVRNLLCLKAHQNWLQHTSQLLEAEVLRRTAGMEAAQRHVIHCLARAAEYRDNNTGRHVVRVGLYAGVIARALGMPEHYADMIEQAAKLHDVGKIGIPDTVLLKPGKLDPEEVEVMQRHCGAGRRMIEPLSQSQLDIFRSHVQMGASILDVEGSPLLQMAARIAMTHHERWDGRGYPLGLEKEQIPLEGRITAVADVFDALSSRRPYKDPISLEQCLQMLKEDRGTHFEPRIVDAFIESREQIIEIQLNHSDAD